MSKYQEVQVRTECDKCEGAGWVDTIWLQDCDKCDGDGWLYAWLDPSHLFLGSNPTVQRVETNRR